MSLQQIMHPDIQSIRTIKHTERHIIDHSEYRTMERIADNALGVLDERDKCLGGGPA